METRFKVTKAQKNLEFECNEKSIYELKLYVTKDQMDNYISARLNAEDKERFKDAKFYPTKAELFEDGSLEVSFILAYSC